MVGFILSHVCLFISAFLSTSNSSDRAVMITLDSMKSRTQYRIQNEDTSHRLSCELPRTFLHSFNK